MTWDAEMRDAGARDAVEAGREALVSCDWVRARACFEEALAHGETPAALDGLGQALYWQGAYPEALERRERAYALYRERGGRRQAAWVAVQLAQLHGLIYGNAAAVSGWIGHARRMLEDCGDCPERGWLELFLGCVTGDPAERERRARAALAAGRRFGAAGLEYDALGYVGKALLEQGSVEEGMVLIDEAVAAATGGLLADPWAAGEIYCTLFHACELAVDVRRAEQWLDSVDHYVERTGELPISAICRMHYGGLLTEAGRWDEAERELEAALAIYRETYRGSRFEPLLRLADLRVRQGRLEEAERLLDGHDHRPEAAAALARLRLARAEPASAATVIERRLAEPGPAVTRGPLLEVAVRVELARGDPDRAREHAAALAEVASTTGQAVVRGRAALSRARIAVATGGDDARAAFEEALTHLGQAALPYLVATTRLELAALLADESPEVARSEARTALEVLQRLGARRDADAAAGLLRRLGERAGIRRRADGTLTPRQREVLDLLAEGLSNADIAERLHISPRTAEHHVSNILATLGLGSRGEATAWALREQVGSG